eukprot:TRINITY_DN1830_c0_g1_i1.p1 TRINITY_DN1830_c0_g1~~TRINITY_DN1830_c0_g1_i1.p1  ORF type:complete len:510 (+),score=140.55 TRINITY_DN1830_c0_g1_i1:61-1590(+)
MSSAEALAAERKAESLRELHPYVAVVAKKLRAARKKLLKLEEYEKKVQDPKAKLLPEQIDALKAKPKLEILVEEFEDVLRLFEEIPKDASAAPAEAKAAETPVDAAQLQGQRLADCSKLIQFYCVSDYLSPHVVIPEEMYEGILTANPDTKLPAIEEFKQQLSNIAQIRQSTCYLGSHISLSDASQSMEKYLSHSADALNEYATYANVSDQVDSFAKIIEDSISATAFKMAQVAVAAAAAVDAPVVEAAQEAASPVTTPAEVAVEEAQPEPVAEPVAEPVVEAAEQKAAPVDAEVVTKTETPVEAAAPSKKSSTKNTRSNTRTRHSDHAKTKTTSEETVTRTHVVEGNQSSRTIITTKVIETVVIRSQPTGYAAALSRGLKTPAPAAAAVAAPAPTPVAEPVAAEPVAAAEEPAPATTPSTDAAVADAPVENAPAETKASEANTSAGDAKPPRTRRTGDGGDRRRGGQPRRDGQGGQHRRSDNHQGSGRNDARSGKSRSKDSNEGWKTV